MKKFTFFRSSICGISSAWIDNLCHSKTPYSSEYTSLNLQKPDRLESCVSYLSTGSNPVHRLIRGPSQNSLIPLLVLDLPGAVSLNGACGPMTMGILVSYLVSEISQETSERKHQAIWNPHRMLGLTVRFFVQSTFTSLFHSSCWGIATQDLMRDSTAPSSIDPVLTVQPDNCYIFFFFLKNTCKCCFINYHNIIHLCAESDKL